MMIPVTLCAVKLQDIEQDVFGIARDIYSKLFAKAINLITLNVTSSSEFGNLWNVVENINNYIFQPVALSLVVLFFLMGFCATSTDVKQELTFESVLKLFLKLSVTEALVYESVPISKAIIETASRFTSAIVSYKNVNTVLPSLLTINDETYNMSATSRVFFVLITLIHLVIAVTCGAILVGSAYIRFFKVLTIFPFGTLAVSTIAGGGSQTLANVFPSYLKYLTATVLETVGMAIGFYLAWAMTHSITGQTDYFGLMTIAASEKHLLNACAKTAQLCISYVFSVFIVTTSKNVAGNALGLKYN